MFCKYCGKKIERPEKPCPHCEKEQGPLYATNGYFGILGIECLCTKDEKNITEELVANENEETDKKEKE